MDSRVERYSVRDIGPSLNKVICRRTEDGRDRTLKQSVDNYPESPSCEEKNTGQRHSLSVYQSRNPFPQLPGMNSHILYVYLILFYFKYLTFIFLNNFLHIRALFFFFSTTPVPPHLLILYSFHSQAWDTSLVHDLPPSATYIRSSGGNSLNILPQPVFYEALQNPSGALLQEVALLYVLSEGRTVSIVPSDKSLSQCGMAKRLVAEALETQNIRMVVLSIDCRGDKTVTIRGLRNVYISGNFRSRSHFAVTSRTLLCLTTYSG